MDIMSIGKAQQQILEKFAKEDNIIFFGDKCQQGGNDFDISRNSETKRKWCRA